MEDASTTGSRQVCVPSVVIGGKRHREDRKGVMRMFEGIVSAYGEWVAKNFGSDAGERGEPGSKVRSQISRVVTVAATFSMAERVLRENMSKEDIQDMEEVLHAIDRR